MSLVDYGLRGCDHIGLTVPNLDEAVKFFTEVIGCEYIFDGGSVSNTPKFMSESLNVNPKASLRYCFVRCKNGSNFELFEYESPDQKKEAPKNSDIGGHHLAIYVDDIYSAVKFLKSKNLRIFGDVNEISSGPAAGSSWVYFLAPWGLQMELVSFPNGKDYEKTSKRILWHSKFPGRI